MGAAGMGFGGAVKGLEGAGAVGLGGVGNEHAEVPWSKMNPCSLNTTPNAPKLAPQSPKWAPRWHQCSHKLALLVCAWSKHGSQKPAQYLGPAWESISGCDTNNMAEANLTYSLNVTLHSQTSVERDLPIAQLVLKIPQLGPKK